MIALQIVSISDAIKNGLKKYFTGELCPYGHYSERRIANNGCIECERVRAKKYYDSKKDDKDFIKSNNERNAKYRENNKEKVNESKKQWAKKNRDMLNKRQRDRYANDIEYKKRVRDYKGTDENKEKMKAYLYSYYRKNKDKLSVKQKERNIKNKEKRREYIRLWQRERNKTKIGIVSSFSRRSVARAMLKKSGRTFSQLGYTSENLIKRIEYTFKEGMSWENYGKWHIDHIIPISHFVSKGVTDIKIINSLCNLRALWAVDNLKKHNKHPISGD